MATRRFRFSFPSALLAVACGILASPRGALAADDPQGPGQPPASRGTVVVERVETGPAFGVEFKYTEINRQDAFMLGGYAGAIFDGRLFIGGAGYWQIDSGHDGYHDYYDYDYYPDVNGYGGLLLEVYALRTPAVSVSVRGLVGGGVSTVRAEGFHDVMRPMPRGGAFRPMFGYAHDQTYFVFEPQANVSLRIASGVALVGGVGYRVIGWADGWEDQIEGLTGTIAVRLGGH